MFESMIAEPYICGSVYEDGLVLQYAFALRTEQVANIRFQDLTPIYNSKKRDEIISFIYAAPRQKGRGPNPGVEKHEMDQRFLAEIIEIYGRASRDPSALVVPGWKPAKVLALVKRAAAALGWDELVKWVNHSVKHGSSMNAGDDAEDQTEEGRDAAIAARTDHMSQPVRAHYGTDALTRHVVANTRQRLVKGDIDRGQGRTVEGSEGANFKVVISRDGLKKKKILDASKKKAKAEEKQRTALKKQKKCEKLRRCYDEQSRKKQKE